MAEPWTRSQIALLRKLWNEDGLTASQCAAVLGITRNAVIGKVHRENYPKRGGRQSTRRGGTPWSDAAKARSRARHEARRAVKAKKLAAKIIKTPPAEVFKPAAEDLAVGVWNALPGTTPIDMMDPAQQSTCRWPIGDGPPFLFCGCEVASGSSYCPTHKHIATGKGSVGEQNAVRAAKKAAGADLRTRDWLEAA